MDSRSARGVVRIVTVLDALPDALVFVDRNGLVVNANTSALGMFETPGAALFGLRLVDLLSDCDLLSNPGSTRCAEAADHRGACARPTRMTARRTDGTEFPVEVSGARLEDGRETYDVYGAGVGDELAMIVVRDLTGTLDTEAQLIRSQRQTEMILRAADEGFVGTDVEGRVVLANPLPRTFSATVPANSGATNCTRSCCIRTRTAGPFRTRSPHSPTPSGPAASTDSEDRRCGRRAGSEYRST